MNRSTLRSLLALCPVIALLVSGLALAAPLTAELPMAPAAKLTDIDFPDLPDFEIGQPQRIELPNGLVVMTIEDHELPLVTAYALARAGSYLDPADKTGLAGLATSVMRSGGAGELDGDAMDDVLEDRASSVEMAALGWFSLGQMSCLKDEVETTLGLLADVLRRPRFPEDRLEIARNQQNAGIARQNDSPGGIRAREIAEVIYGEDSAFARQPTFATVGSITREDLQAWHAAHFHPNQMVIGLVGDFDTDELLKLIEKNFGDWAKGPVATRPSLSYQEKVEPGVHFVEKNDVTQSFVVLGHLGIKQDNPDYYATEVLNEVFSGGFDSRLFSTIRGEKGLAYSVGGGVDARIGQPGMSTMTLSTKVETTGAAIEALLDETRNLIANPPTQEEVGGAKDTILNSFIFNFDSKTEILQQQLVYELYGYPSDWLSRYRAGIENVTRQQIAAAAKRHLRPGEMAILVVGPKEGMDRPLSDFGEVHARDITIPGPPTP